MPQMMPIWWSMMLIMSMLFFLCFNCILYFFPLISLSNKYSMELSYNKSVDLSKYDL